MDDFSPQNLIGGQQAPFLEYDNGNSGAGTVTLDFAKGNRQKITMTGNCTFAAPSNLKTGATYILRLIGDASAIRIPVWNAVFIWPSGVTPTLGSSSDINIFAFYCDGTNLYASGPVAGCLLSRSVLTAGTTFTTGNRTKKILIQLIGGGGGGGGTTGAANQAGVGGGGGSGSYAEKFFTVLPNTAYTYAIGGGGNGGVNTGATGSTGGASTFAVSGTTVTANGGLGGVGMTTGTSVIQALGGNGGAVSTNGDVNTAGQAGTWSHRSSGTVAISGVGASGYFGGGGNARNTLGTGNAGGQYGAGGGGACSIGNNNQTGGAGSPGVIIVWEFS